VKVAGARLECENTLVQGLIGEFSVTGLSVMAHTPIEFFASGPGGILPETKEAAHWRSLWWERIFGFRRASSAFAL